MVKRYRWRLTSFCTSVSVRDIIEMLTLHTRSILIQHIRDIGNSVPGAFLMKGNIARPFSPR